jgi:hypothetical protein
MQCADRRLAMQFTPATTFDSCARLKAFKPQEPSRKHPLRQSSRQLIQFLSHSIQQKPNARINRRAINVGTDKFSMKDWLTASPVQ